MCQTQKIKISGDGARMSRTTSFVVLSFLILAEGEKVMSEKGTVLYRNTNFDILTSNS